MVGITGMGTLDFRMFRHDSNLTLPRLSTGQRSNSMHHQYVAPRDATPPSTIMAAILLTYGNRVPPAGQ
jgi:hypothetical protein